MGGRQRQKENGREKQREREGWRDGGRGKGREGGREGGGERERESNLHVEHLGELALAVSGEAFQIVQVLEIDPAKKKRLQSVGSSFGFVESQRSQPHRPPEILLWVRSSNLTVLKKSA